MESISTQDRRLADAGGAAHPVVRLADVDVDFAGHDDPKASAFVRSHLLAPLWLADRGLLDCPIDGVFGLVLSGFVQVVVAVGSRQSLQLLGPGDLLPLDPHDDPFASVPSVREALALGSVEFAVIDGELLALCARVPSVLTRLTSRLQRQGQELAVRLALAQAPQLEHRILGVLWQLADRWGLVGR